MDSLFTDLRYTTRRLAAAPAFTSVAVLTLAVGIAATTAIYSVVDALMLRPLPYRQPGQLVDIWIASPGGISTRNMRPEQLTELRARGAEIFEALEPSANRSTSLTGDGEPEFLLGSALGGGLMKMLGVAPQIGRGIEDGDVQPGRDQVVVLSDGLWRRRFGADSSVLGRTIRLDGRTFEVIGVMPASFRFPYGNRQLWVPLVAGGAAAAPAPRLEAIARLRADTTVKVAQARIDAISAGLRDQSVLAKDAAFELRPPIARHLNQPVRRAVFVLFGAVSFVMLIACANLANLLLVQGAGREREIAVRAALGASRRRLLRQLLTEALVLAAAGGLLGVLLAQWAIDLLATFTPRDMTFLSTNQIRLDGRVVGFAAGLTILTAGFFGLLPAWRGARAQPNDALKEGARASGGGPRLERLRRVFVTLQLAVSLILLVGAGLLTRTFAHITAIDPGFDPSNVVTIDLSLPRWKYSTIDSHQRYFDQVLERLRATPGIAAAAVAGGTPPGGGGISFRLTFEIEGRGIVLDDPGLLMPFGEVDGNYFDVVGIPLKAGRTFSREDTPDGPRTMIISEVMARRLWKGDNPIGQRLRTDPSRPWYTVVGVVGDVYQLELTQPRGLFAAYYPTTQSRGIAAQQTVVVRTDSDPVAMIPAIRQQIRAVDPDQPFIRIGPLADEYAEFFATPRFYAFLMTSFAAIGLAISAVGLYGVLAFAIAQRTREFGIRMALGAQPTDVLRLVLASGFVLVATGLVLGGAGSLLVTRALESLLVEVPRTDPLTYAVVTVALGAVALIACWIPARRATQVDPVVALRCE